MEGPLTYRTNLLEWEKGRQLKKLTKSDGKTITYTYNANGIRTSKTVGTSKHTYILDGTKILSESYGAITTYVQYDSEGSVCGISYNGTPYYFLKNQQGDVIAITNKDGEVVCRYTYDAWGKVTSITGSLTVMGQVNPFRYRGYYYDRETGLYYLQSRYYDPETGRFVNADETRFLGITETVLGYNLIEYCENRAVDRYDPDGHWLKIASYYFSFIVSYLPPLTIRAGWVLANYLTNRKQHFSDYIYGQGNSPVSKMRFGLCSMSFNGCELIAIYNVAKMLGKHRQLYNIALEFESNFGQMVLGLFGTNPFAIERYLYAHKFKYKKATTMTKMNELVKPGGKYILSFWNTAGKITKGLHTIAVRCNDSSSFTVYNRYNLDKQTRQYTSLSSIIGSGSFICGYYVY